MAHPITELLTDLSNLTDEDVEKVGRDLYKELFLDNEEIGVRKCHDNEDAVFYKERFDHAFFKTKDRNSHIKIEIDKGRVARIKWILPMIQGGIANSEYWHITEKFLEKRLYANFGLGYVVWLWRGSGEWTFSSAYTAEPNQIRRYTKGGKKITSFK
ncbi:MAG TPA: hypothetical protein VF556_08560 [Pyrinomonadaceae bacterium]